MMITMITMMDDEDGGGERVLVLHGITNHRTSRVVEVGGAKPNIVPFDHSHSHNHSRTRRKTMLLGESAAGTVYRNWAVLDLYGTYIITCNCRAQAWPGLITREGGLGFD